MIVNFNAPENKVKGKSQLISGKVYKNNNIDRRVFIVTQKGDAVDLETGMIIGYAGLLPEGWIEVQAEVIVK